MRIRKELKSDVVLKKGKNGWEAWQTNKLIAKVPGFSNRSKQEVMKHIPGYENVIESGVKGMNTNSINRLIERETGLKKSEKYTDYVRDSGNGNIAYRLVKKQRYRNGDFHVSKDYQNTFDIYLDNVDARKRKDDVIIALENAGCTNIIDNSQRGFIKFDVPVGEKIMNGYERNADSLNKLIKSSRTFDDVESQILFDNIVGGQDEMFFDWYSEKYGELPWNNLKSIPKERIAEYVNENPDVLEDMEYEIGLSYEDYAGGNTLDKNVNDYLSNSKKPIKSSTLKDLDEYIAEDYFCERYALDNYIVDKLIEMGFTNEQVEFEWDSPMVKKARKYLEDLWWDEENENFSRSYSDWAENLILNDKFETEEYKRWILNKELRKEYPDGVYEDKDGSYMKRIKELSTEIDNNITNAKRKLKSGVYVPDSTGVSEEDKAHNEFMNRYSFDPARNTFPGPERY